MKTVKEFLNTKITIEVWKMFVAILLGRMIADAISFIIKEIK